MILIKIKREISNLEYTENWIEIDAEVCSLKEKVKQINC